MIDKEMSEIVAEYAHVRTAIFNKVKNIISNEGGKITFDEDETKVLKLYTSHNIVEMGISERVSGDVYIKTDKGVLTAFDCLNMEYQYNVLCSLTDWY